MSGTNTNAILPFATGTGANVETPAAWSSDSVRQLGFQTGILSSAKLNEALRQASVPSAMLAQFIANYGNSNVNDDGNLTALLAQFVAALSAFIQQAEVITGTQGVQVSNGIASLNFPGLPLYSAINANDLIAGYAEESEDGQPADQHYVMSVTTLASKVLSYVVANQTFPSSAYWYEGTAAAVNNNSLTATLANVPQVIAATPAAFNGINILMPITSGNAGALTLTVNVTVNGVAVNVNLPVVNNATGSSLSGGEMSGGPGYVAYFMCDGVSARLMNSVLSPNYVPLAGGTMTGPLVLSGAPTAPLNPATKAYVDGTYSPGGIGYERKSNGRIEQWGFVYFTGGGEGLYGPYTFPIAFPNGCDNLSLTTFTPETPSATAGGDNVVQLPTSNPATATQFWVWNNAIGNGTNNSSGFFWRAIGH